MTRAAGAGREVEEPLELAADRRRRCARASRGRAGCARTSAPTGRRSSRSRRRRAPPAAHRSAAAAAARRSGRGGRRGASRPTGRTRCSRDRPTGRQTGRQSGRRRVQDAPPFELVEEPAEPSPGVVGAAVTAASVESSRPSGRRTAGRSRPLCYRAATHADQPRAAPAPSAGAPGPPQGARRVRPSVASSSSSSIILLVVALLTAGTRARVRRGRVQPLRAGPAGPEGSARPTSISSSRRSSTTGPARSSSPASARCKREVVTFDQIPGEMHRCDDRDRGQGLLDQRRASTRSASCRAGLDTISGRPRGASTITQQLVRARLLPPEAFDGTTYERKVREIIQSVRLTQAYPGRGRQGTDHHRVPEPELLRQQQLRREGRGQGLLRQAARGPDARPVRDPRRDPAVTDEVRPHEERRRGLHRARSTEGDECPDFQLVVPATSRDRPAPQLHPRADEDARAR